MVECQFKLLEKGIVPQGKLVLRESEGGVEWEYTSSVYKKPLTGKVKPERYDYLLVGENQPLGRLKNFSLYSYNPRMNYRLDFKGREYRCEISDTELKK